MQGGIWSEICFESARIREERLERRQRERECADHEARVAMLVTRGSANLTLRERSATWLEGSQLMETADVGMKELAEVRKREKIDMRVVVF